jgi:predicted alpha-1,6-mannanase (GH76 family)
MLLARASQVDGDERRLAMARDAADWLHASLVDRCGIVWDGCRPRGGVLVPEGRLWSYNVGTVAGLDVVLAGMSGVEESQRLLTRAARVVRAGTAALRAADGGAHGGWRDEVSDGSGADPQLFRGILARYATGLVLADPSLIDIALDLVVQAESAWKARDARGRIGAAWGVAPAWSGYRGPEPTLAAHLSGALLLGSAARLDRAGLT